VLVAHARGHLASDAWQKLHDAAGREERLSELAFAYESGSQGSRLQAVPGPAASEFLYQAAIFIGGHFGDELGAITYLERAVASNAAHLGAFEKLDQLLTKNRNHRRLAEVCAERSHHRPRAEQLALLKRAAELFDKAGGGGEEKSIEVYQQPHLLEPHGQAPRGQLESRPCEEER